MGSNESPAVLITGAGITGLILALSLIKNGVSVRIIDKQERIIGRRGLGLHGRSLETHKLLGLLPDVLKRSGQIPVTQLYSLADPYTVVKTLPFFEPYETTVSKLHINTVCFSQDKHEDLVREHLQKLGCTVESGKELTVFEQQDDHVVAHVKSTLGETEIIKPQWLVGADGAHSIVRKSSGLTFLGEPAPSDLCVISDATLKCNLDKNFTHMWGDPSSKGFLFFPPENKESDLWSVFCVGTQLNHEFVAGGLDNMAKEFSDATGRTDIEFVSSSWLVKYRPQIRMVNSFRAGRVLVAGDAAHVHSATGGQGLNSGIQDAVNLGWKLALVAAHKASPALLDSYNDERLPVIATMLRLTTALLDRTIHPEEPGDLRGLTREFALRQFGVNYRKSPIIEAYDPYRSGDNGEARAGDRAPGW
ncbi:FAD-binding monooxygenase, partial [Hymenopellis radicata]